MLHTLLYTYIIVSYLVVSTGLIIAPSINPEFSYLQKISKVKTIIRLFNIFSPISVLVLLGIFLAFILYSTLQEIFPDNKN